MCCVVGYIGRTVSRERVVEGLTRLEYRGYDSAGFACLESSQGTISAVKVVGGVDRLIDRMQTMHIDGMSGIGHTRWSTHGVVNETNAHPVFDCLQQCAVVHNGIVENERALRAELLRAGHRCNSDTDSELIAHLIEEAIQTQGTKDLVRVLAWVVGRIEGAYTFVALHASLPHVLLAVRKRSPLCIGLGEEGIFVASDPLAYPSSVSHVVFVPDDCFALITPETYALYSFAGEPIQQDPVPFTVMHDGSHKAGYAHYMLKEIYEEPQTIKTNVQRASQEIAVLWNSAVGTSLAAAEEYVFIGCGTSLYAAACAHYFFESVLKVRVTSRSASDFRDRELPIHPHGWYCLLSQSGETADTLEALRAIKRGQGKVLAVTNRDYNSMKREADVSLMMHAGMEVAVASSKTLSAHMALFYLLAHEIAIQRGYLAEGMRQMVRDRLIKSADLLQMGLSHTSLLIDREIAPLIAQKQRCMIIGRGLGYIVAQETALKLKELAYIFAEAYLGGELKHGPLALVDEEMPVIVCSALEETIYQKLLGSVHEVRARKGFVIACAFAGQDELIQLAHTAIVVPAPEDPLLAPLVMVGVLQYLAYRVACELGRPIDKPRNLAKSVTVE